MCWCLTLRGLDQAGGDGPAQARTARGCPKEGGAAGPCSDASVAWFPFPSSGLPLPLPITCRQRKPPASPLPQVPGGKMGLIFRFLYRELTASH